MMQQGLSICVIICVYTEARWNNLTEAVASLRRQTYTAEEIIVVVDHNPVLLNKVRREIADVTIVENTGVQGLSDARNSGIAKAKSSIIAFLDDDAEATPEWLRSLHEAFMDNQVVGVGGAVIPAWQGNQPYWFPEEFLWVVGCTYRGMPQERTVIRNPIGANMAFRWDIFSSIGGFRSEIGRIGTRPIGCEETELCIRVHQHQPQSVFLYQPQAIVYHRVPSSRMKWSYFCSRCYSEGLSKALVTRYVGTKDTLTSEYTYTLHILPQGVLRYIKHSLLHLSPYGFLQASFIVIGLTLTTVGYVVGSMFSWRVEPRNYSLETGIQYDAEIQKLS